ncbi:hypothetical protein [Curtobacterium sp. AG1037]|uniref:hypothetical protein n=1 Tax=Curtobacterium sp. AG1037 TaxID=2183990 RepID=UPI0011C03433|nr:hypothetical protein [Curtobacterium sp. AG1037]
MAAVTFLLLPAAVILVAGLFVHRFEWPSLAVALLVLVGAGASVVAARRTSAFLICSVDTVIVGFAPFWRTTLRARAISAVDVIEVDAFAEYGGWGIKGGAREERGRLYSAGGRHAVRLWMLDGRTFVVAFSDRSEAERARTAVAGLLEST